jgi:hypothetical protein
MVNATVTNGKYSSIASISVPRASRNTPEIASIIDVIRLAIQLTMPSNIQSRIMLTSPKNK